MLNLHETSRIQVALNFVKQIKEIDRIIIGVNTDKQLLENIEAYNKNIDFPWKDFAYFDNKMLDPQQWHI